MNEGLKYRIGLMLHMMWKSVYWSIGLVFWVFVMFIAFLVGICKGGRR